MIEIDNKTLGVIVARMQVPNLHKGHIYLIDHVRERHPITLILLGCSPISVRDPLHFLMRKSMIVEKYPTLPILPVDDMPGDDEAWSYRVDSQIRYHLSQNGLKKAKLYGSRESFIPYYRGEFSVEEIAPMRNVESGSDVRSKIHRHGFALAKSKEDFFAGVIWASQFLNK